MKPTMKKLLLILSVLIFCIGAVIVTTVNREQTQESSDVIRVTVTTTFLGDVVERIGGQKVEVTTLMGPGIDPHQYQASSSDLEKLMSADLIFYGGLHLEAKLAEILDTLSENGVDAIDTSRTIPREKLLLADPTNDASTGTYDPHIWFDIDLWKLVTADIAATLSAYAPQNERYFEENYQAYVAELDILADYVHNRIQTIPQEKQYLITAHDAFNYFGVYTGMNVRGIQGFNTVVEAGTNDVSQTANLIVDHQIQAIFVESTVSPKLIQALQEAVQARGQTVEIGGSLYSDSTGSGGTPEATYIGMY